MMRTVAVSSALAARPWTIIATHSARSPSGTLYRISIAGELRIREAWTLGDALRIAGAGVARPLSHADVDVYGG